MHENIDESLMSCEICCERTAYPENKLVFCELCNLGVHQLCYGTPLCNEIPEGDWYCDRCKFCMEKNIEPSDIKCFLCNYSIGSLKKLENNKWVHIICVNWIPDIYFENSLEKNTLAFTNQANFKKRKHKLCYLCGSKDGYCISCEYQKGKCQKHYHVYCARKYKLIFPERLMILYLFDQKNKYTMTFCLDHLKKEFFGNKSFSLEAGLLKEKDDSIQKEIIKNRTDLDEQQIQPEVYHDPEIEDLKEQYKEITQYLLRNNKEKVGVKHSNSNIPKEVKYKRKKRLFLTNMSNKVRVANENESVAYQPPNTEKKIKRDPHNGVVKTRNPETIQFYKTVVQEIDDSQSSTSNNCNENEDKSEDLLPISPPNKNTNTMASHGKNNEDPIEIIEDAAFSIAKCKEKECASTVLHKNEEKCKNINEKSKSNSKTSKTRENRLSSGESQEKTPSNPEGFLELSIGEESLPYGSNSPTFDKIEKEKAIFKTVKINEEVEVEEDNDFFYLKDNFQRYEVVDKLKTGQLLTIETLKNNQTFTQFFDNLHYGRSKIMYLDNPFHPKPTDKIQIIDLEHSSHWNTVYDSKSAFARLLSFKIRADSEPEKNNGVKKAKEDNKKKEEVKKIIDKNEEFITGISNEFAFVNNFDFEGLNYLQNQIQK